MFRKVRDQKTLDNAADSTNAQEQAIKKAEELLKKHNIFNNVSLTASKIAPLNNVKLQ